MRNARPMGRITVCLLLLTVTACGERRGEEVPITAYRNWDDRLVIATRLYNFGILPCASKKMIDGVWIYRSLPTDECYRMTKPGRWRGVWVDEFEGSRFCPGARLDCPYGERVTSIWFTPAVNALNKERHPGGGDRYLVDFIGRRTLVAGSYGHMGVFDHEMILDRMISIKPVEGPKENAAANK